MRHKLRKLSLAALGILTAAFALLILTANKSTPIPPLPNPNGYDDFVKAASFISGDTGDTSQMEQVALKGLISTNAEAFAPRTSRFESDLFSANAMGSD